MRGWGGGLSHDGSRELSKDQPLFNISHTDKLHSWFCGELVELFSQLLLSEPRFTEKYCIQKWNLGMLLVTVELQGIKPPAPT